MFTRPSKPSPRRKRFRWPGWSGKRHNSISATSGRCSNNEKVKKGDGKKMKSPSTAQVRATISFPPDLYETLEQLAKQKKVSLAWVVRDAAERYVAGQSPSEPRGNGNGTGPKPDIPEAAATDLESNERGRGPVGLGTGARRSDRNYV